MDIKDIKDFFGMYGTFQEDMLNLIVFLFTKQIRKDFPKPYKKWTLRKREWSTCHETSTERFFQNVSWDKFVMLRMCICFSVYQKEFFWKKTINILKF